MRGFKKRFKLGKFDIYKIALRSLTIGVHSYEFNLDSDFFKNIDGPEVQRGNVLAKVLVDCTGRSFDFTFSLNGVVKVSCDRCLDDMDMEISHSDKLIVKLGKEYAEEGDNIIIVPESEGEINIAWFLYEFIALVIPIKHIHPPGKCNRMMSSKLKKHTIKSLDDDEEDDFEDDVESDTDFEDTMDQATDPRWDELKNIIDTN